MRDTSKTKQSAVQKSRKRSVRLRRWLRQLFPNVTLPPGSVEPDPWAELAKIRVRHEQGEVLNLFNPFDEMAVLAAANEHEAMTYAMHLADVLVIPTGEYEGFFEAAAKNFLRALSLFIFVAEPPERRTLARLRQLVVAGDVETYQAGLAAGIYTQEDTPFIVLLDRMMGCGSGPYAEIIAGQAEALFGVGEKALASVLMTARHHTAFLDSCLAAAEGCQNAGSRKS